MSAEFDLNALLDRVGGFTARVPKILRRTPLTLDLAEEVERCLTAADAAFTLAIVGQMRVGKSSLINALVGDDVAITGVTETTATVNWLLHGTPEQAGKFRVVWNDLPPEDAAWYDLAERDRWIGNSELAHRTRYLQFFHPAEMLKTVRIVDTPGTRSVLQDHEQAIRGFMAEERAEQETLRYGGAADCVLYVIPPVARQNDADLLNDFVEKTRLANSSAYNSMAVLHKWETLEHPRPWEEAQRKAKRAMEKLGRHVADVIPVSGPLAAAAARLPLETWMLLQKLALETPAVTLERILGLDTRFRTSTDAACTLDAATRSRLLDDARLPWPCLKTIVLFGAAGRFESASRLRDEVRAISGIDALMTFLQRRFFDRSRLIRAANLLGKSLAPIEVGCSRLRDQQTRLAERERAAEAAEAELNAGGGSFTDTRAFLRDVRREYALDDAIYRHVITAVDKEVRHVRDDFDRFQHDLTAIQLLDRHSEEFTDAEAAELYTLLGARGYSLERRLGVLDKPSSSEGAAGTIPAGDELLSRARRRKEYWSARREKTNGENRPLLEWVVSRLAAMIDELSRLNSDPL